MSPGVPFDVELCWDPADGSATLAVAGEVDVATGRLLANALSALVGVGRVNLDLAAVEFLDCAGLAALEEAITGGAVQVVAVSPAVHRVTALLALADLTSRPARPARAAAGRPVLSPVTG